MRTNRLGGYHFRRQQIIAGFIVDFYCHAANLIIELDGDIHLQQAEYDTERDEALLASGFQVLHFRNEDIHRDLSIVLKKILTACKAAKRNLFAPFPAWSSVGPWPAWEGAAGLRPQGADKRSLGPWESHEQ